MSLASEALAERIRDRLLTVPNWREQKMFGGIIFMLDGNMLLGPTKEGSLLVRVGKDGYADALEEPGAEPMRMAERTMNGFVEVSGDVLEDDEVLDAWIARARAFVATLPPK
jgi:TfoX/Sxy family transcriptional regulator of competence genes